MLLSESGFVSSKFALTQQFSVIIWPLLFLSFFLWMLDKNTFKVCSAYAGFSERDNERFDKMNFTRIASAFRASTLYAGRSVNQQTRRSFSAGMSEAEGMPERFNVQGTID